MNGPQLIQNHSRSLAKLNFPFNYEKEQNSNQSFKKVAQDSSQNVQDRISHTVNRQICSYNIK